MNARVDSLPLINTIETLVEAGVADVWNAVLDVLDGSASVAGASTFAKLVVMGELAIGALLLIGLLVRPASFIAIVMCLNYLCGKGEALVGFNAESMLLVILVTAMLINPGRALGVDGFLYERLRLPNWII